MIATIPCTEHIYIIISFFSFFCLLQYDDYNQKNKQGVQLMLMESTKSPDEELIDKKFKDFCQSNELETKEDLECQDCEINSYIDNEVIKEGVDTLMMPIYVQIQESVLELYQFGEDNFVKDIIDLNEEYLLSLDEIIDKNYK